LLLLFFLAERRFCQTGSTNLTSVPFVTADSHAQHPTPQEVHRRQAAVPSLSNITFDELAAEVVMLKRRLNALPQGPPGPRGARGYRGEAGTIGSRGSTGNAGTAGADGANGYCAIMTSSGEVTSRAPSCAMLQTLQSSAAFGRSSTLSPGKSSSGR
jgi:hypothetical protein